MLGFNYNEFKAAIKRVEEERFEILKKDIDHVKEVVERAITMALDCSANKARMNYPGVEL